MSARFRFSVAGANAGKISALGIKLPEQTIQVLVCAFLPGAIWVGKKDFAMQPSSIWCQLANSVPRSQVMVLTSCGGKADSVATMAFSMVSARRSGIFTAM